ncbi:hypothetical protein [Commensalibacter nepenthis]|uniref:Uncharacterized protein n=1 Tax=Commensalibacter nepenthis TaxID=3043872 RepID=A0ABT6Q5D6_9PROT|nr:hypothetical protein [Commensalibacter sp. TBRC 10068]MDI2112092.1 hypothetical protein [Commensalibacter sp. TBRC 10068]
MNLRGMLKINTSITMACFGFMLSLACGHAKDNITTLKADDTQTINTRDITTPLGITASQLKIVDQYQSSDGTIVKRPLIKLVPDDQSFFTLGKETVQFGGDYDTNGKTVPTSLSVYGRPYGNYNAGCTLCVFSSAGGMSSGDGQAAVSGLDYRVGASAITNGDMATVGFYHYDDNTPARIVTQASSFGVGVVTLSSPMTDEQMSQLHQGMYIATNVIDPNMKSYPNLIVPNRYWGYIKSWDANHIYVYDWAVRNGVATANHLIPDVHYLDNELSTYKVPMVFIGVSNKIFAENEFMVAEGSRVIGDNATAIANEYEREEFDFRAHNWTKPHSLTFHGWTTSFECRPNCHPNAVTEDSYAYLVNGPDGLPRAFVAQTVGDGLEFSGFSTFIGGDGAPHVIDKNGYSKDPIVGSNHIMNSFASRLSPSDYSSIIHMNTIINREVVKYNDWRDYGVRLVMDYNSKRDRKKGLFDGDRMGSIVFNYNGAHYGGVCLLGNDSNQGLCQEGDGSVNFAQQITAHGNALFGKAILTSAAGYNQTQKKVNGQGSMQTWNTYYPGNAHTEFTNIDPTNDYGGFDFYNTTTGASIENKKPLVRFGVRESFFDIYPMMKQGLSVATGKSIFFQNSEELKGVYLKLDAGNYTDADQAAGKADTRGDLFVGSNVAGGANIRGVNGYYGQTAELTNKISAPKIVGQQFVGTLSTPSSASAPCTVGEFKDDVNYHYVCVGTNKWKRVALSDF